MKKLSGLTLLTFAIMSLFLLASPVSAQDPMDNTKQINTAEQTQEVNQENRQAEDSLISENKTRIKEEEWLVLLGGLLALAGIAIMIFVSHPADVSFEGFVFLVIGLVLIGYSFIAY